MFEIEIKLITGEISKALGLHFKNSYLPSHIVARCPCSRSIINATNTLKSKL